MVSRFLLNSIEPHRLLCGRRLCAGISPDNGSRLCPYHSIPGHPGSGSRWEKTAVLCLKAPSVTAMSLCPERDPQSAHSILRRPKDRGHSSNLLFRPFLSVRALLVACRTSLGISRVLDAASRQILSKSSFDDQSPAPRPPVDVFRRSRCGALSSVRDTTVARSILSRATLWDSFSALYDMTFNPASIDMSSTVASAPEVRFKEDALNLVTAKPSFSFAQCLADFTLALV